MTSTWPYPIIGRFIIPVVGLLGCTAAGWSQPVTLSAKYGTIDVSGKEYVVQNNVWGADTAQVLSVNQKSGAFTVVTSDHNMPTDGVPASYASIFRGSHWGNVTANSGLPLEVDTISSVPSIWKISGIDSGAWDAAYDIWFDTAPSTQGQPDAAELMIWINHRGGIRPAGQKVATVSLDGSTWDLWTADFAWKYIAYVRTGPSDSVKLNLKDFCDDAVARGLVRPAWYLIGVEAGFELWRGGAGLASKEFSVKPQGSR